MSKHLDNLLLVHGYTLITADLKLVDIDIPKSRGKNPGKVRISSTVEDIIFLIDESLKVKLGALQGYKRYIPPLFFLIILLRFIATLAYIKHVTNHNYSIYVVNLKKKSRKNHDRKAEIKNDKKTPQNSGEPPKVHVEEKKDRIKT